MCECPKYTREELYMFDNLPSGVLINLRKDSGDLEYGYSNEFLANSLGYTHEEFKKLLIENCFAAIYEADREKTRNARVSVGEGNIVDSITRQKKKDGSFVWILAHIRPIELDGRKGMLFLFSRIQELIGLQNKLSAQNDEWSDILKSVPIGLLVYREYNGIRTTLSINRFLIDFANSVGNQLDSKQRSWTEAELAMILNKDIYAFCEAKDKILVETMLKECLTKPVAGCIFRLQGSLASTPVYISTTCASKENSDGSRTYYVTYQNVTDSENAKMQLIVKQEQLYKMSYYDALTGVKNRNAYNQFTEHCKNNRIYNVGVAFCDINGLKQTNDTMGHYYGDKMIHHFSDILKAYFDVNCVYRLSGDEFVIICPSVERDVFDNRMKELIDRIKQEKELASIGYVWKESVSNIQRRTTQAEQLMYVEKQKYYEESKTVNSKHRPHMLQQLLKDFDEGRFAMFLQPKTSIDGTKVIGAEALARKYDIDGSVIAPYAFVPQLEKERLIPKLDFFMLEETCRFLQEQHMLGNDDFCVSVNVSRVTIAENDFIHSVEDILSKYNFLRKNIELELTESNQTMDSFRLKEYMGNLKNLGVKISLDDMGNDYSTISMLTLDGFDWVKLDRSLIIQLCDNKARILVKHIINACHDLGLKVIAEGVETDDIRELLMKMSCDAYQGYLKSKPVSEREFKERFLRRLV